MSDFRNSHRIIIEESRDCTNFEGFLQSKMSIIKFNLAILDMLIVKKDLAFFNTLRVTSAVLKEVLIKQKDKTKNFNEMISGFIHYVLYENKFEMMCGEDGRERNL